MLYCLSSVSFTLPLCFPWSVVLPLIACPRLFCVDVPLLPILCCLYSVACFRSSSVDVPLLPVLYCLSFVAFPLMLAVYCLSSVAYRMLSFVCCLSSILCRLSFVARPLLPFLWCLSSVACRLSPLLCCLSFIIVNQRCSVVCHMFSLASPLLNDSECVHSLSSVLIYYWSKTKMYCSSLQRNAISNAWIKLAVLFAACSTQSVTMQ